MNWRYRFYFFLWPGQSQTSWAWITNGRRAGISKNQPAVRPSTQQWAQAEHDNDRKPTPKEDNSAARKLSSSSSGAVTDTLEGWMRTITGDPTYQFGDLTKKAYREITGKDNFTAYEFGDVTRGVLTQTGRTLTGNEDYQFGDLTKAQLAQLEATIQAWQSGDPLQILWQQGILQSLSPRQRRELIVAMVRLGAVVLVTWGCVQNLCNALILAGAWFPTRLQLAQQATASLSSSLWPPRGDSVAWRTLMASYSYYKIWIDPFLLLVKAAGSLVLVVPHLQFMNRLENSRWTWFPPQRERYPLVHRILILLQTFAWTNLVLPGLLAWFSLGLVGAVTGLVPASPV